MAHKKTLDEVVEMARQAELVCRLLEDHPHQLDDLDVSDVAALLRRLCSNVAAWLTDESVSGKEVRHG